jgi:Ca-activated chloride channel family protein
VRRPNAAAVSLLPYAPGGEDGFALITVTPPASGQEESTPRDITLVLDVSGSMSGRKMEQARAAGHQLLGTLRPQDRFRIVDFSSDVRSFRDDFVYATRENVRDAGRYLDALEAVGGTNIEGALRETMRAPIANGRLPIILFVTDGEPTVGERSPERLAAIAGDAAVRNATTRRIFTFGLGSDVNVTLLEQLALEGRGTSQFVRPEESVERMVGVVAQRLVDPVLTDVRVRVDGDIRLSRMLPSQAADVFADRDLVIVARYSGHGSARVVVEGRRRGTLTRWESVAEFPERERANPFVARLWATQRVGFLSAEKRRNGGNAEVDDEIKSLGERFGIPTEFTSYLVVEPRLAAPAHVVRGGIGAAPPAAPAPAMREMRFESAKAAAAQRSVTSAADIDSLTAGDAQGTRRVGARTFKLQGGRWTDVRYKPTIETLRIKPFSAAYFDVLAALPELRDVFAMGSRLVVSGRGRAVELTDEGRTSIDRGALDTLVKNW